MQAAKPALCKANTAQGRAVPLSHTSLGARHGQGLSRNQAEDFPAAELRAGKGFVSSPEHTGMGLRDLGDNGSDTSQHFWCINVPGRGSTSLKGTSIPHRSQHTLCRVLRSGQDVSRHQPALQSTKTPAHRLESAQETYETCHMRNKLSLSSNVQ